jgi:hypothetical protein
MLGDITQAKKILIVCGYTDYPRSIIIREEVASLYQYINGLNYGYSYVISGISVPNNYFHVANVNVTQVLYKVSTSGTKLLIVYIQDLISLQIHMIQ